MEQAPGSSRSPFWNVIGAEQQPCPLIRWNCIFFFLIVDITFNQENTLKIKNLYLKGHGSISYTITQFKYKQHK